MSTISPMLNADFPGVDIIRVGEAYYMLCGSFHFYPGGGLLRSYDLKSWERVGYVYDSLEGEAKQKLMGERSHYGQGMWSGCIRHHKDKFYVMFTTHDPMKTYVYVADQIEGPWTRSTVDGIFQDCTLLFDEDGEAYAVYGYKNIYISQLNETLTGPKEGGLHKRILSDSGDNVLEYSGAHMYRINGSYYLFVLNRPTDGGAKKIQYCFKADFLEGPYEGREIVLGQNSGCGCGIARGGIVDTPDGKWYGFMQRDYGAAGRLPILMDVEWQFDYPLMKSIPNEKKNRHLFVSDAFDYPVVEGEKMVLNPAWQWNHEPREEYFGIKEEGGYYIKMGKISTNLVHSQNTITQPAAWPKSAAEVTVDASLMKEGDFAGICALQGCYGMVAITKEMGTYYLVMMARQVQDTSFMDWTPDYMPGTILEKVEIGKNVVRLRGDVNYEENQDTVEFSYKNEEGAWCKIGTKHKLYFKIDHFTGCRYGLFGYATKNLGGEVVFKDFKYVYN